MRKSMGLLLPLCYWVFAQQTDVITDEARVPQYTLPAVLTLKSGQTVSDAKTWMARRRPEILAIYEAEVYGKSPARPPKLNYEVKSVEKQALGGKATRKIVTISFGEKPDAPKMDLLMYLPSAASKPAPMILGLSFGGIHTVANDPGVPLAGEWGRDNKRQLAAEKSRGSAAAQWQLEKILTAGYGLATVYYEQIEPDFAGGMQYGIRPLFFKPGQTEPGPGDWATVAAWAWGASRAMDYLEKDRDVDARRVGLFGHSRLGKAAIWAGAQDSRFTFIISNESGEGGAAISRRDYGERTKALNTRFPHWFDGNFKKYNDRENEMPFESHMALALIAPRGLYVASAEGDQWSDPKGEFLGAANASPVWELFGKKGIGTMTMPGLHEPVGDSVRYHIRAGKHDVTEYDWQQYLKFAAAQWGR
jgi:hypothetical protein